MSGGSAGERATGTYGGDEMDDETREWRLARGPVGRPEAAAEGEGDAFLCELCGKVQSEIGQ